jgi:hypothetical protein
VSAELGDYERRLRRAGLPLLIEDYSAREDVFNRAIPFLALVFLAELGSASNLEWSLWANVAAVLVGLVVLLAPIAALNVHRGGAGTRCPSASATPSWRSSCSSRRCCRSSAAARSAPPR